MALLSKEKHMPGGLLQGSIPWVIYFLVVGHSPQQMMIAIGAALVATIIYNFEELKQRRAMAWANFIIFAIFVIFIILLKNQWLTDKLMVVSTSFASWVGRIVRAIFGL
jgi:hypothetical protein